MQFFAFHMSFQGRGSNRLGKIHAILPSFTACAEERIKGLRSVTAKDGVHFVDIGYKNLAGRCVECLSKMLKKSEKEAVTKPEKKGIPTCFFWRGFRSTRGSSRQKRLHDWIPGSQRSRGSALGIARGRVSPIFASKRI